MGIQFCMRFSVLADFVCGFAVLDDFFFGFAVSSIPNAPLLYVNHDGNGNGTLLHKRFNERNNGCARSL